MMRRLRILWARLISSVRSFFASGGPGALEHAEDDHSLRPALGSASFMSMTSPTSSNRTLFAIGENEHLWYVLLLVCPCGCGAAIALNTLPDDAPRWRLEEREDGPTLLPSVWRTTGCRSHFILRPGQVVPRPRREHRWWWHTGAASSFIRPFGDHDPPRVRLELSSSHLVTHYLQGRVA